MKREKVKEDTKKDRKKNNKSLRNKILSIIEIVLLVVMIVSGIKIVSWTIDNNKSKEVLKSVSNAVVIKDVPSELDKYVIDFNELEKTNSDVVGWIKVNNTNVEYPVVKTTDNDYYLKHSFDKSDNSAGWVFADFRNKADGYDTNMIIYGHNRKDNSMFGSLTEVFKDEWIENEENRKIVYITKDVKVMYEIFSVYTIYDENYYITTDFENEDKFEEYINTVKSRSIYDLNVDVNVTDRLLTLSTCNITNHKTVIHAKKIEEKLQN